MIQMYLHNVRTYKERRLLDGNPVTLHSYQPLDKTINNYPQNTESRQTSNTNTNTPTPTPTAPLTTIKGLCYNFEVKMVAMEVPVFFSMTLHIYVVQLRDLIGNFSKFYQIVPSKIEVNTMQSS